MPPSLPDSLRSLFAVSQKTRRKNESYSHKHTATVRYIKLYVVIISTVLSNLCESYEYDSFILRVIWDTAKNNRNELGSSFELSKRDEVIQILLSDSF